AGDAAEGRALEKRVGVLEGLRHGRPGERPGTVADQYREDLLLPDDDLTGGIGHEEHRRREDRAQRPDDACGSAHRASMARLTARKRAASGLRDPRLQRPGERFAYSLELDPVEDVLEEPADDQALRGAAGEP